MEGGARTIANFTALDRFPDDWRLYARSASDDKAPIVALMAALDSLGGKTRANLHVVLDGEEEMGSPSLTGAIARYRDKLRADLLLILDGPVHPNGRPTRCILKSVPDDEAGLLNLFGVVHPDAVGESLQEALQFPSLNIRGMRSGYVDEPRTIIPADATAAIDIRLVKETPAARMLERLRAHIEKQGYHIVEDQPDDATRLRFAKLVRLKTTEGEAMEAYRTEPDSPAAVQVTQALERMWGAPPVQIRTMGGTVPIAPFIRELGVPAVSVPIVSFDNNQHSDNENLRMGNLWSGIVTLAATLQM